jgi:hypothetical protein
MIGNYNRKTFLVQATEHTREEHLKVLCLACLTLVGKVETYMSGSSYCALNG